MYSGDWDVTGPVVSSNNMKLLRDGNLGAPRFPSLKSFMLLELTTGPVTSQSPLYIIV